MTHEQSQTAEIPTNPFEGLSVESYQEDLALAEAWQSMTELEADKDSTGYLLAEFQFLDLAHDIEERSITFGYEELSKDAKDSFHARGDEAHRLGVVLQERGVPRPDRVINFAYSYVDQLAARARWRLAGVNPEEINANERVNIEISWSKAAEAKRTAEKAQISTELAGIDAKIAFAPYTSEEDTIPGLKQKYQELHVRQNQITSKRDGNSSSASAGWGISNGDGLR